MAATDHSSGSAPHAGQLHEDADIRRMAEQTIQAQERETAELQRWTQTHD